MARKLIPLFSFISAVLAVYRDSFPITPSSFTQDSGWTTLNQYTLSASVTIPVDPLYIFPKVTEFFVK